MLKIKLTRFGKKHEPHYRIVVAEDRSKATGAPAAILGHYHPISKSLTFDKELVTQWIKKGAQPTDKVRRLLHI